MTKRYCQILFAVAALIIKGLMALGFMGCSAGVAGSSKAITMAAKDSKAITMAAKDSKAITMAAKDSVPLAKAITMAFAETPEGLPMPSQKTPSPDKALRQSPREPPVTKAAKDLLETYRQGQALAGAAKSSPMTPLRTSMPTSPSQVPLLYPPPKVTEASEVDRAVAEILNAIRAKALKSAEAPKINLDGRIERVTVRGTEDIVVARENMSAADNALVMDNAGLITEQNTAYKNKTPSNVKDEQAKTVTIDYHTSPEKERMTSSYGGTAAVVFTHNSSTYRFDGMQTTLTNQNKALFDFITHFHSDHIDYRALEQVLKDGLAGQVFFPLPMLDRSMRKKSFETMWFIADTSKCEFDIQNSVCQILPADTALNVPVVNSFIGQFMYSQYRFGDLSIETYRHINPKNENMDGIIYRIQYKNVSQLNFGDFDNEEELADLLKHSGENQKKRMEIQEEYYALEEQIHSGGGSEELIQRRNALYEQLQLLPTVTADVVKWPHHARILKNIEFAEQLNRVVNPHYFIYQAHPAQDEEEFEAFIRQLSFREKFINSANYRVDVISLIHFNALNSYVFL